MTKEQLLQDRYKVINPYPHSPYEVGDLVEITDTGTSFHCTTTRVWNTFTEEFDDCDNYWSIKLIETFPNLFRKLSWWEDRDVLPDYVKSKLGIFKVNWTVRNDELYLTDATDENDTWIKIHEGIDPSDIQEYNDYLATKP